MFSHRRSSTVKKVSITSQLLPPLENCVNADGTTIPFGAETLANSCFLLHSPVDLDRDGLCARTNADVHEVGGGGHGIRV